MGKVGHSWDMKTLKSYLTVQEAAETLGVSAKTLRRWDNLKKLPTVRNPLNGYRLYDRNMLESLLRQFESPQKNNRRGIKWNQKS